MKVNKTFMDKNPEIARIWDSVENYGELDWSEEQYKPYMNLTYHDIYQ